MSDDPRVDFLRSRGVEVDLPEERMGAHAHHDYQNALLDKQAPAFSFLHLPCDLHKDVALMHAPIHEKRDVLPKLLANKFDSQSHIDQETLSREAAARIANMFQAGGDKDLLKTPSADTIQQQAAGGVCEAYPLAQANESNSWMAVRLYIDEIGALRGRPRNSRAEALAAAAGLHGLSIHGDAYIGRCEARPHECESNVDFKLQELAHDSDWVKAARSAHIAAAEAAGHGSEEHLSSGDHGLYSWSQTEEEVDIIIRGAPEGKGASRRVRVDYGSGSKIVVSFDSTEHVSIGPLFDKVTPDECNWTLEGGELILTLAKAQTRAWATLNLPQS